ncbi:nicotinamide mononucleotide transporter family protein [Streptomyces sp. Rer75]|uniref:nicotinamide mononucleotide transporter family protein n=1 Tax=unclassified Streptomyces TaxID=2593676 RepID=UPI0015CFFD27|nr:nicotinamide mononucleotide transporter family protein [Streptomyces sp. Rer75]QLH25275.1 nicotinamide mononucleotide transporter [Streptomyces sp. Rer75]
MSALDWLGAEAGQIFGQHILWSDAIGNTIGLAALALGRRRSLWTWPVQLASGVILVAAYASAHLSGGVGKQLLVIGVAAWGWRQWRHGRRDEGGAIAVRFATGRERAALLTGLAVGTLAVGALFTAVPELSWNPWPDAYIFVGTLAAMVAQARGLIEFWFAWMLVDVVGVPLAFSSGLAFSGLVYVIYFALVLWGARDWWLRSRTGNTRTCPNTRTSPSATTPAMEGVSVS